MSTFILRAGKDTRRRSPRANKGQRELRFIEEFREFNPFSKEFPDKGQEQDLEGLLQTSSGEGDSPSWASDDSAYRTEETPESESIPECEECGQEECVCGSLSDSEFSSSMGEYESDDDESLLSGGECSGCGKGEEKCQCDY